MSQIVVQHEGLTFVHTRNGQVQVWKGDPGDSPLVGTGVVDGMVMGPEGPAPILDVLDEDLLRSWADEWLEANPQARPLTEDQIVAREALVEVLTDILSDPEVVKPREEVVLSSPPAQQFIGHAFDHIPRVAQAKVIGGAHPSRAGSEALVEALQACLVAGFVAGQTFQQRGYRL